MKILILLKKWEGGVGSVVKYISKEFEKNGHSVKIISREDDLNIFSLRDSIFPLRKIVLREIKENNFDIIYAQDWSLAFPLLFPTKICPRRLFCSFYGENPKKTLFIQTLTGIVLGSRLIVCNDNLKRRFPKSHLIYNRVDAGRFKPAKQVSREKNTVGFANWKTDEYRYSEIKQAVESLGKKFVVAEGIPKDKMPDFFRRIETFVSLPPAYAGFGLVYLEAMASGVPKIVGSNYGGGKILPITKVEDYPSIADALSGAKKQDYRKWVIENNFTWREGVERLIKIFKSEQQ